MKKITFIIILSLFAFVSVNAQPGHGGDNGGGDFGEVPIDGGIISLLIAGAAYGVKIKYRSKT